MGGNSTFNTLCIRVAIGNNILLIIPSTDFANKATIANGNRTIKPPSRVVLIKFLSLFIYFLFSRVFQQP